MHDAISPERARLYLARQERLREVMRARSVPALLAVDPVHVRYATGARNMQVFGLRDASRCLALFADGPAILFEYPGTRHSSERLPTLTEVRDAAGIAYVGPGSDTGGPARRWAAAMAELVREQAGAGARVAVGRLHFGAVQALVAAGLELVDADLVLGTAGAVEVAEEVPVIRASVQAVERAAAGLVANLRPGMTENEHWAHFHHGLIERDGEYVCTRLFAAGARTLPDFRECGDHVMRDGDLLAFDTDAIGMDGYAVDFSRAFLLGERPPTPRQRDLFGLARAQLEQNVALFRPGASLRAIADRAWPVPAAFRPWSYYVIAHGIGLAGGYPAVPHRFDEAAGVPDGVVEPGMTLCVESYVGDEASGQGVKLEQHLLIGAREPEVLSDFPFDERLWGSAT